MNISKNRTGFQPMVKLSLIVILVLLIILSLAQLDVSHAANGSLDLTYSIDGKVNMMPVPGSTGPRIGAQMSIETYTADDGDCIVEAYGAQTNSSAIQADDKMIVVGHTYTNSWKDTYCGGDSGQLGSTTDEIFLGRLNQDGSLDTNFGSNGMVLTDVGGVSAQSVAIQTDGKILVAGTSLSYSHIYKLAIVRYNSDGSLDSSFGTDGISVVSIKHTAKSIAIQSDGKIVVAGTDILSGYPSTDSLILIRFNSDGSLDTGFDEDGILSANYSGDIVDFRSVVIQPDNKIVVVGEIGDDFAVTRFNSDGSLDISFNSNGWLTTDFFGSSDSAYAATIQSDQKILVVGSSSGKFAMARYNLDGSLDTSFGEDGLVTTHFPIGIDGWTSNEKAISVNILSDGKIVIAGIRNTFYIQGISPIIRDDNFAVVRYNHNGELDLSFGSGGLVTTNFDSQELLGETYNSIDFAHSSTLQSDGKLVMAGDGCLFYYEAYGPPCGLTAARYLVEDNYPPNLETNEPSISENEGQTAANSGTVYDPDGDDLTLSASIGNITDNNDGTWSWSYTPDDGSAESQIVTLSAEDSNGSLAEVAFELTVNNVVPTAVFENNGPVGEGSAFTLLLPNPFDPSNADTNAGFEYSFDCGDGSGYTAFNANNSVVCPTYDDGDRAVKGQIRDKDNGISEYTANVTVNNLPPIINEIIGPSDPVPVGTAIEFTAVFTDPGVLDTHSLKWDWDDGSTDNINPATSPSSIIHTYSGPGVYAVSLTLSDDDGGITTEIFEYVVVYDSSGAFVTGAGWIDSTAGAYIPDPTLIGKATFGFVSKYKKGASVPTGNTVFIFKVADLAFQSNFYDWLIVTGSNYARFKGTGTINGDGEYNFMIWAGDGETDTFRIRIWEEVEGVEIILYDNSMDQPIGGGNIVVHTNN